ncbi:MAG: hypothetical protein HKN88_03495 [Gammaproteobacteria bacterium]|nr:hypothetical protein [Gammaproteobacteria bacterium]NNC97118.1 hypothetical protein [Gammaproteobacteria bacterium]NNM14130.1 hypothetical protein [Gammaproteobacteria bacterium]
MSLIVLAVVSVVAFAAMRLSMNVIYRSLDKFKGKPESKKTIRKAMLIISPIVWVLIFIIPMDYGGIPRDMNLWIMNWSVKVIGYFATPALVAVFAAILLENK